PGHQPRPSHRRHRPRHDRQTVDHHPHPRQHLGDAMPATTYTPAQAIARSRSWSTYPKLLCANHVWRAYMGGSPSQDSGKNPSDNGFPNSVWASASNAWKNTPTAHKHTDKNPPLGALVYYGGSGAGHVVLSLGGGRVRSTDYPQS